jgi:hypothetical protein
MRTGRQAGGQAGKQAEDRKAGGGLTGGQAGRPADRKTNKSFTVNIETFNQQTTIGNSSIFSLFVFRLFAQQTEV